MSVGHELSKLTGLKLFHNHVTIELVLKYFDWNEPQFKLAGEFRRRIFEEVAASNLPGLIFTYVWALGEDFEKQAIDSICSIFRQYNAEIMFVELEADLAERLRRNRTEFRLREKPSKRNVAESERKLLEHEEMYTFNSDGDFTYSDNYMKINNNDLTPVEAARLIVERFELHEGEEPC